ncbi:hypothetical protein SAMN02745866_02478 [Alteromonadaceae bacterium Bs31]|nr:hypothetical protein SAMN02745866_02478 [Alteromonadaceae bacterium Bs31]
MYDFVAKIKEIQPLRALDWLFLPHFVCEVFITLKVPLSGSLSARIIARNSSCDFIETFT